MPVLHMVMLYLMFFQSIFYLSLNSNTAKFLTLFKKAFFDAIGFLVVFVLLTALFGLSLHVLGARFDDGGNFDPESYDTNHNDYSFTSGVGVAMLAAIRNSIGDIQPPSYDYWTARYQADNNVVPYLMIMLIWIVFVTFLFVQVILALNFLIAIVSQSYESIMDRQLIAVTESKDSQVQEYMQEINPERDVDVELMVFQTATSLSAESDWDGLTQTIKKII